MTPADTNVGLFPRLCADLVAPQLAAHGFAAAGERQPDFGSGGLKERSLVYRRPVPGAEPHYLMVQLITIPGRTPPPPPDVQWVQILLGEGDHVGVESWFNSISIWDLTKAAIGEAPTLGYGLRPDNDLPTALGFALHQLIVHAADFLAGDLSAFRRVRAMNNAEPRSYAGITHDETGRPLDDAGRRSQAARLEAAHRKYASA